MRTIEIPFSWRLIGALFVLNLSHAETASGPEWTEVAEADLLLMGEYQGQWVDAPEKSYQEINPSLAAQVINVGVGDYRVIFVQELNLRAEPYFDGVARLEGDRIVGKQDGYDFAVDRLGLRGRARIGKHEVGFSLKRVERLSPMLGAKPPKGAIALFDGSGFDAWEHTDGRPVTWNLVGGGAMEINPKAANKGAEPPIGGEIRTKQTFKDCRLHLEFRYPVEPGKSGQGRGNSGVFLQGTYEVQVLNSYGLAGDWNELGALYKLSPPHVNAARPPMQWQSYDIEYRAPRFKGGKLVENARVTVRLNGALVQNDVELRHHTAHKEAERHLPAPQEPGPIKLQDHSNRIQFRNIWIEPR